MKRKSEPVRDTDLDAGHAIPVIAGRIALIVQAFIPVESGNLIVFIVGISHDAVNGCPLGKIIGITQRIFFHVLVTMIGIGPGDILDLAVVERGVQATRTQEPFQTEQPVVLLGLDRELAFPPSLVVSLFISQ